jgi:predicted MFS family arabinose efflux permease
MNEAAVGAGGFAGSLIVGYLAGNYGHAIGFQYTPLFLLAAIGLQLVFIRRGKRRHRQG